MRVFPRSYVNARLGFTMIILPHTHDVILTHSYMLTLCSAMEDLARNEAEAVQVGVGGWGAHGGGYSKLMVSGDE